MMKSGGFSDERFYRTGSVASYAVAPVPYEVFRVEEEAPSRQNGQGNYTLVQSWHNPQENTVFKQPRNQLTRFGEGVSLYFQPKEKQKFQLRDASSQEYTQWLSENLHQKNIRVSFYMKLEGEFSHLMAEYPCRRWNPKSKTVAKGGQIRFHTMENPPIGQWFHYESIVEKADLPRTTTGLYVFLLGRGEVRIRDVAVADTNRNPPRR
jgi:1,2-phenylacetyl-CoA epoxidase PaaB subunit